MAQPLFDAALIAKADQAHAAVAANADAMIAQGRDLLTVTSGDQPQAVALLVTVYRLSHDFDSTQARALLEVAAVMAVRLAAAGGATA